MKKRCQVQGGYQFGEEPEPTHIWRKDPSTVYHIDYCFVPETWLPYIKELSIGTPQDWLKHSDHVPLVIEVDL